MKDGDGSERRRSVKFQDIQLSVPYFTRWSVKYPICPYQNIYKR